ncbi:pold2 [Ecytonucleospora hepatopenaei]|uniref:Pold2 n=1 Tax=Ecytonucleospora hepatopenaei TaxID=646526 RepID=A0A1W0E8H5_9MICR|nr:pold2 [Ecytonucleospora hepatopenaei]
MTHTTPTLTQTQLQEIDFGIQYNLNYIQRLNEIRNLIEDQNEITTKNISKIDKNTCLVKAVLFIKSKLKLSVFEKTTVLNFDKSVEDIKTYVSEKMEYFIEDESCKCDIEFVCNIKNTFLTTGMVLGFVGAFEGSSFKCTKIVFPKTLEGSSCKAKPQKFLMLSNAKINKNFEKIIPLIDIYGEQIDDILILGSVFDNNLDNWDFSRFERSLETFKGNVYFVPGANDPTTNFVPQTPLHKLLFSNLKCIKTLPNPAKVTINHKKYSFLDYKLLIKDFMRYKKNSDPIDALKAIVNCRHLAPSAPDTIPSIPFTGNDPFILHSCDFFVCGGEQTDFEIYKDKFLLSLPDFDATNTAVLFNAENCYVQEVSVSYDLLEGRKENK